MRKIDLIEFLKEKLCTPIEIGVYHSNVTILLYIKPFFC